MNLVCQLSARQGEGLVIKVWEAPETFELVPEADWAEQPAPPALAALAGVPPAPLPAR